MDFSRSLHTKNEVASLYQREFRWKQNSRTFQHLTFTKDRLRWFDRSTAKIEHQGCINTAKWSHQGDFLYTGSDDRKVKIWQVGTSFNDVKLAHSIETKHRSNVFHVGPSPINENLVISAAADGVIRSNYINDPNAGLPILSSDDIM
jgi:WD40 repeat protein